MEKLTVNSPEAQSADLIGENVAVLRQVFPEAFTEGKVDFEVLKQLLGGAVNRFLPKSFSNTYQEINWQSSSNTSDNVCMYWSMNLEPNSIIPELLGLSIFSPSCNLSWSLLNS